MASLRRNTSMLTANQVARLLNVHTNTVRRWSDRGLIKAYRTGARGDRRFRQEDIAAFLIQQTEKDARSWQAVN